MAPNVVDAVDRARSPLVRWLIGLRCSTHVEVG
jgi:hypothetical protein